MFGFKIVLVEEVVGVKGDEVFVGVYNVYAVFFHVFNVKVVGVNEFYNDYMK